MIHCLRCFGNYLIVKIINHFSIPCKQRAIILRKVKYTVFYFSMSENSACLFTNFLHFILIFYFT